MTEKFDRKKLRLWRNPWPVCSFAGFAFVAAIVNVELMNTPLLPNEFASFPDDAMQPGAMRCESPSRRADGMMMVDFWSAAHLARRHVGFQSQARLVPAVFLPPQSQIEHDVLFSPRQKPWGNANVLLDRAAHRQSGGSSNRAGVPHRWNRRYRIYQWLDTAVSLCRAIVAGGRRCSENGSRKADRAGHRIAHDYRATGVVLGQRPQRNAAAARKAEIGELKTFGPRNRAGLKTLLVSTVLRIRQASFKSTMRFPIFFRKRSDIEFKKSLVGGIGRNIPPDSNFNFFGCLPLVRQMSGGKQDFRMRPILRGNRARNQQQIAGEINHAALFRARAFGRCSAW